MRPLRAVMLAAVVVCGVLGGRPLFAAAERAVPPAPRPLLVTVDDLPIASPGIHRDPAERERITRDLLAVLARHGVRAVGFVSWANVRDAADERLLWLWLDAGHELGNHTAEHLDYTATDSTTYIADAETGRARLTALLEPRGATVRYFRFPFLREGDTPEKLAAMRRWLAATGQRNLPVTLDNEDGSFEAGWVEAARRGDRAALDSIGAEYQQALRLEIRDHEARGDELFGRTTPQVLLLHANAVGTAQWDPLFAQLRRTGHRWATADEVLDDPAFAEPHAYVGRYGCSFWHRIQAERRTARVCTVVAALLDSSSAAWNRGDLAAFCDHYASDALFVSPHGVTQGRDAVLERYRAKYAGPDAMGTLSFDIVEIRVSAGMEASILGSARPALPQTASVAARWHLRYADRPEASGLTLLVLRPRGGGRWEIVQDASM